MNGPKVSADDGSTAIGGDNSAPIFNVRADKGATVNVHVEQQLTRQLPSILGKIIVEFAKHGLSEYASGVRRSLPPEVLDKLDHNCFPHDHHVLIDDRRYGLTLERTYHGIEQENADARRLVRRRASITYKQAVSVACDAAAVPLSDAVPFARSHAPEIVKAVIDQMVGELQLPGSTGVYEEAAHLAVSLIVADAIIECDVLEAP